LDAISIMLPRTETMLLSENTLNAIGRIENIKCVMAK